MAAEVINWQNAWRSRFEDSRASLFEERGEMDAVGGFTGVFYQSFGEEMTNRLNPTTRRFMVVL
jgi:hypothetical protein